MTILGGRSLRALCATLAAGTLLAAAPATAATSTEGASTDLASRGGGVAPSLALEVTTELTHIDRPWDLAFLPDDTMLVTERDRERITAVLPDGERRILADSPDGIWHGAETGLMGIAVDPSFDTNRTIYACHGWRDEGGRDVRVTAWQIDEALTSATITRTVVSGMEIHTGKHAGCRIRFDPAGALYISTGDAQTGPLPQDLTSLNGKILRVDAATGGPWPGNPFESASSSNQQLIWTYGHRNPQGLAYRSGPGVRHGMWSAEHGPTRDDEVNKLKAGGNYGWDPVLKPAPLKTSPLEAGPDAPPGYFADAPMTDHALPGRQIDARWSSGSPTVATSGATWLTDDRWDAWQGRLAVATLKHQRLLVMSFDPGGDFVGLEEPPELAGTYGDLRVPVLGPRGALYISTDNFDGPDYILKVVPASK